MFSGCLFSTFLHIFVRFLRCFRSTDDLGIELDLVLHTWENLQCSEVVSSCGLCLWYNKHGRVLFSLFDFLFGSERWKLRLLTALGYLELQPPFRRKFGLCSLLFWNFSNCSRSNFSSFPSFIMLFWSGILSVWDGNLLSIILFSV